MKTSIQPDRRNVLLTLGLGTLSTLVAPARSLGQQQTPNKSGDKAGPKTYTPEEAYKLLTSNIEKDLIHWREIKISVLKIEADLKLLDVRLRDTTRYKKATGDSRSYDEVKKSIEAMQKNLDDFNNNHLKPAKEAFDRTSRITIAKFDKMSDRTRTTLNPFIEKDYDKVKKNLSSLKGNDFTSVARREAYQMFKKHLESLGKNFLIIDDPDKVMNKK